jgi:hypothetical protein
MLCVKIFIYRKLNNRNENYDYNLLETSLFLNLVAYVFL